MADASISQLRRKLVGSPASLLRFQERVWGAMGPKKRSMEPPAFFFSFEQVDSSCPLLVGVDHTARAIRS